LHPFENDCIFWERTAGLESSTITIIPFSI
jgi:hypothetical protein